MSEPTVPDLPVFHKTNLPHHPANPDHVGDLVPWPKVNGVECMPMSGTFMIEGPDGLRGPFTDGFLLVTVEGYPYWQDTV